MYDVANAAIKDCEIENVYLFDNLSNISDGAINKGCKHLFINAYDNPTHLIESQHCYFAEDIDRLMLNQDKKKLVMFAGCSLSYGVNSQRIADEYPSYFICNTGVIGGTNADFQFQIISKYLSDGDVFLHAPEEMSEFQLLDSYEVDSRVYMCVEGNYDLFAMVDCSKYTKVFDEFGTYAKEKKITESKCLYSDINPNYNSYGDYIAKRSHDEFDHELERMFALSCQNEQSYSRLNTYYDDFTSRGIKVLFSYAPLDDEGITYDDRVAGIPSQYENNCNNNYHAEIISSLDTYIMDDIYFYDTDYHLTTEGAEVRTTNLIKDLRNKI